MLLVAGVHRKANFDQNTHVSWSYWIFSFPYSQSHERTSKKITNLSLLHVDFGALKFQEWFPRAVEVPQQPRVEPHVDMEDSKIAQGFVFAKHGFI